MRRFVAWEERDGTDEVTLEQLISGSHGDDLDPPPDPARYIILTSGTTGTPKGAQRSQPEGLRRARCPALQDPEALARDRDDRGAPLPLLGLPALHPQPAHGRDDGAAPEVRPRGHPQGDRRAPRPGAGGGPGDDAADPRPAGGGEAPLRPLRARGDRRERLDPPGELATQMDGRVRRQPLQPLRLDGGRLGDDRNSGGHARGSGHGRQAPARHRDPDRRRGRPRRAARRDRAASSSATSWRSRATRAAATRSTSAICSPRATSGTSTRRGACSSTAVTTR